MPTTPGRALWRAALAPIHRRRSIRARRLAIIDDDGHEVITLEVDHGVAIIRVGSPGDDADHRAAVALHATPALDHDGAIAGISLIANGSEAWTREVRS